jgi:hypothetical protein
LWRRVLTLRRTGTAVSDFRFRESDGKEGSMSEVFVEDLQNARKKLVAKRRAMAAEMARAPAVSPASAQDFTAVQEAIDSIEEALAEEEHIEVTGFVPSDQT